MIILWSQVVPDGKNISSISIELDGPDTIGKSFILQNLQIETGIPYKPNAIDKSITNLMATGAIEDVKVFLDPNKSFGSDLALVIKVVTKARIGKIDFIGNDKISKKKLENTIQTSVGELLDESEIKADQKSLQELYLDKGYWNSRVDSEILKNEGGEVFL